MSILNKIKELVIDRKVIFTVKAGIEMERDGLLPSIVYQAILNAPVINKTLRSADPKTGAKEYLFIIIASSYNGTLIYTKGKIKKVENEDTFYILISSKRSIG